MHTLISTDLGELAAQRRAVVFAVSRQVPGADPELATSCGLEQLCREVDAHGAVDRPVDYWHHAAIDAATEASATEASEPRETPEAREAPDATTTAVVHEDSARATAGTTEAPAPPDLPPSIEPAGGAIVLPHTAQRRLRQAGKRPVLSLADTDATAPDPATCRVTRGAMHDYIRHRLLPGRRRELEDHLVDCAECARAFTDVRESYWIKQAAAPVLRLGTVSVPDRSPGTVAAAR